MIGLRIGAKAGPRIGGAIGIGVDEIAPTAVGGAPTLLTITVTAGAGLTFKPTASGDRLQMTATGHYDIGPDADITTTVTWDSGTVSVATVSNGGGTQGQVAAVAGAITSASNATSLITATLGAVSGNATVTVDTAVDATSGFRVPSNAYQWSLLGETPSSLWLCQEASGNLADSIGSLALLAGTAPLYQQAITGLTRLGVGFHNATNDNFTAATATGPIPTTTSSLWIAVVDMPASAPGASRDVVFVSDGATSFSIQHTTGDRLRTSIAAVNTNGASDPGGLRLVGIHYDRDVGGGGVATKANAYTDQEKVTGTYSALVTDGNKGIGNGPANAGDQRVAYVVEFQGAAAERTTGSCKTLWEKLIKTAVSWS